MGNISASWPASAEEIWRVNPDGEIRDTYQHLTKVFEMQEEDFFKAYCGNNPKVGLHNMKSGMLYIVHK